MILRVLFFAFLATASTAAQVEDVPKTDALEVHFNGNQNFSASDLRKSAIDEESDLVNNGYRKAEVDDMAFQMEAFIISMGHPFARVRWNYEIKGQTLHATFGVSEGPRTELGSISFQGNTRFTAEELTPFLFPSTHTKDQGNPAFVEGTVMGAAGSIAGLYRGLGHKDVKVDPPVIEINPERTRAEVVITIREGVGYTIQALQWSGNDSINDDALETVTARLLNIPYLPRRRFEFGKAIEGYYADHGFPDAHVTVTESFDATDGRVEFDAVIAEGLHSYYSRIVVSGNSRTSSNFIRNRLALESGLETNHQLEEDSFRNLFRTGLFKSVEMGLADADPQQPGDRELHVNVEEGLNREFTIEPGYGSYEQFRLLLGWRDKSILGTGRILRIETGVSVKSFGALVGITDPWLFESEIELDAPVFYRRRQEPSFNREETGLAFQFRYAFNRRTSLLWGYRITVSEVSSQSAAVPPDILIGNTTLASVFVGPRYDSRNDYFNPTKGAKHGIQFEYGGSELGSDIEFVGAKIELAQYFPIDADADHIVALGARSAVIQPVGDTTSIPLQLRLFNGGENTARGFHESRLGPIDALGQPIGGETMTVVNAELRQNLASSFWTALFVDYGNVGREVNNYTDDFRLSYGAGLRLLLPVGALRLDVGVNPSTRASEENYVIHFSVGMAF
jgi:outer membrane protein insertion porin family